MSHRALLSLVVAVLACGVAQAQKLSAPTYAAEMTALDARITALQKRVAAHRNDWLIQQHLGAAVLEKSNLSGSVTDVSRADEVIRAAIATAPKGSGPLLLAAHFNFSVHRLREASTFLDQIKARPILQQDEALAVEVLRADIAFQRGEYAEALEVYERCEALMPILCSEKLILYYAKTGRYAEAEALSDAALMRIGDKDPHARAWVLLQSAIRRLDQQRYPEALTKLEEANTAFPGWWLVREHMAEVLALQGNDAAAITIYDEVIDQTGLPQYMDAQAECYMRVGRSAEATALFAKAEALWKEQLRLFPESASGHALEHFMALNHDPALVVRLAEENFSNRPGGDARLLLAKAYLSVGRPKDALAQVHALLASPYRTVEGLEVALETFRAVGDEKNAARVSAQATSEKSA